MTTCVFPRIEQNLFQRNHYHGLIATMKPADCLPFYLVKPNFQIFIKTLTGQSVTLDVSPKETVNDLKYKIWKKLQIPVDSQRLIFQMTQLQDEKTLESYKLQKESTVHLALRLVAGVQVKVQTNQGRVYALNEASTTFADSTNTYQQPNMYSYQSSQDSKKRGTYTKKACANCRKSHSACDAGRPCRRCLQLGLTDCMDAQRKSKKRDFEEMNSFQPFTNMLEFLPLLDQIPKSTAVVDVKKESLEPTTQSSQIEFEDLFNDVLDIKEEQETKKQKIELFEEFQETPIVDEFQFSNNFDFSFDGNNDLSSLVELESEKVELFPEEDEEEDDTLIESAQDHFKSFEKSIVPYQGGNSVHPSKSVIIPREEVEELTNGDPQQDFLMKSLMIAHLKQQQELGELRGLVSHLQSLIIAQAALQNPPKNSLSNYQ
jgi:hypothetical protein